MASGVKQMPKRTLVDTVEVKLLGDEIWGWVNYDPDRSSPNRQFVVQFGGILCRCPFFVRDLRRFNTAEWPEELKHLGMHFVYVAEKLPARLRAETVS